jgi:hypothetical protein
MLVKIVISVCVAYLICGIAQVVGDLTADPVKRPSWAWRPTLGKVLVATAIWFTSPLVAALYSSRLVARTFAFAFLGVILQMIVLTALVWGCISISQHLFDSVALQATVATVMVIVGAPIVIPLLTLLMTPLTILIMLPLDLLFPIKDKVNVSEIMWCRNCRHYKKSREFEDVVSGLYRSGSMPRSDKLPCDIALETARVWERYYGLELGSRAIYPKDCEFFEQRSR